MIFFKLTSQNQLKNFEFRDISAKCKYLTLFQMSIPFKFGMNLPDALKEYEKISSFRSPYEKIQCIVRSFIILGNNQPELTDEENVEQTNVSPDQLIPLFIIMVLWSNVINMLTILDFIKLFTFEEMNITHGSTGYVLSTIDAAMKYISNHSSELKSHSENSIDY